MNKKNIIYYISPSINRGKQPFLQSLEGELQCIPEIIQVAINHQPWLQQSNECRATDDISCRLWQVLYVLVIKWPV